MKLSVIRGGLFVLAAAVAVGWTATPAYAVEEFYKEFAAKYSKPKSKNRNEVALSRAIEQAKCTICHPNDDKHKLTSYGTAVAVLINKYDKDKKKKIQETFDKVANRRSDSYDPKSATFGEQIKQGKIPEGPD
jgi:hypothetical protein